MTAAYELWRVAMYGVGVFATCNVGGAVLRTLVRRASGRRKARPDRRPRSRIAATPKRNGPFYEDLTRPGAASILPEVWRAEP